MTEARTAVEQLADYAEQVLGLEVQVSGPSGQALFVLYRNGERIGSMRDELTWWLQLPQDPPQ